MRRTINGVSGSSPPSECADRTASSDFEVARPLFLLTLLSVLLVGGLVSSTSTAEGPMRRRVLTKPRLQVALQTPRYRVEPEPESGNLRIFYKAGGTEVVTVFEPATKVDVVVEADVEMQSASGTFTYNYTVTSLKTSSQRVEQFFVSYASDVLEFVAPEGWVGRPGEWMGWTGLGAARLEPGESVGGFSFRVSSKDSSLPGIVDCFARGQTPVPTFQGEPPEGLAEALPSFPKDAVRGRCIGPVLRPLTTRELINRLVHDVGAARAEGWILDERVGRHYEDSLREVADALQSGEVTSEAAIALMMRTLASVESDHAARNLTAEAYALLGLSVRACLGSL